MQLTSQLFTKFRLFKAFMGRVAKLSLPYFISEEKWHARGFLLIIVLLNLGTVFMAVQFNDWYKLFYNALEKRDQAVFWTQLGRFTYLAFGAIIIAVYKFYLTQLLEMRWRKWMTTHYLERWLTNQTFYKLELMRYSNAYSTEANTDNPDQRISEDVNQFTSATITLSMGFLDAVVTLVSFVGILWALSGSFSFTVAGSDYNIPGFMVWAAIVYCVLGSVLTHYLGRSQIKLNFFQQRYEADFRHHMVRVREYSEAIALDKGENVEIKQLGVGELPEAHPSAKKADLVHHFFWSGRCDFSLHRGSTAFFQRCDSTRRADTNIQRLWPGAGLAELVCGKLQRLGCMARHHGSIDQF